MTIFSPQILARRRKAVVAAAWTPVNLGAELVAWYKADVGVYNDAGTTLATNTQTVQQWNDQSGNSNHLKQSTSGERPQYLSSGFNTSFPCIRWTSAGGSSLSRDDDANNGGITTWGAQAKAACFVVMKWASSIAANRPFVAITSAFNDPTSVTDSAVMLKDSFGNPLLSCERSGVTAATQSLAFNTNARGGIVFNGSTAICYVNGVGGTSQTATNNFSNNMDIVLGGKGGSLSCPDVDLCEVLLIRDIGSNVSNVDTYLKNRWGL